MEEQQELELGPNETLVSVDEEFGPDSDPDWVPSNLPVQVMHDVTVFPTDLFGLDSVAIIVGGFSADADPDDRVLEERIYVLSAEDGLEVARRIKAVAATVKPLRKQIPNTEDQ